MLSRHWECLFHHESRCLVDFASGNFDGSTGTVWYAYDFDCFICPSERADYRTEGYLTIGSATTRLDFADYEAGVSGEGSRRIKAGVIVSPLDKDSGVQVTEILRRVHRLI